jgi:hypothetical protein
MVAQKSFAKIVEQGIVSMAAKNIDVKIAV